MKRLLKAAATAAMLAIMVGASVVATSPSALAKPPGVSPTALRDCYLQPDQTLFCFWSSTNYTGTLGLIDPIGSGHCVDLTANGGFAGWSYYNHSGRTQRVWSNGNCTGANRLILNGGMVPTPPWPVKGLGGI